MNAESELQLALFLLFRRPYWTMTMVNFLLEYWQRMETVEKYLIVTDQWMTCSSKSTVTSRSIKDILRNILVVTLHDRGLDFLQITLFFFFYNCSSLPIMVHTSRLFPFHYIWHSNSRLLFWLWNQFSIMTKSPSLKIGPT